MATRKLTGMVIQRGILSTARGSNSIINIDKNGVMKIAKRNYNIKKK